MHLASEVAFIETLHLKCLRTTGAMVCGIALKIRAIVTAT